MLVFDGQKDDVIPRLWDWNRAIETANRQIPKLLAAGRTDVNPVRLGRHELERFRGAAGFDGYFETSAAAALNVDELRAAIVASINWDRLPWRSSPATFRRIRSAILRLKDSGRILTTAKELLDRLPNEIGPFPPAELDAVLGLLVGPGAIARLGFGEHVLLRPELINAYGQAVIRTLRQDPEERGCITEQRLLDGDDLDYPPNFERLGRDDEAVVLRGLQRELVDRAICIRDQDATGRRATLLVFPSYFRRERPEWPGEPNVFTTYRFDGYLDETYATLVVRLHHTELFESKELWRNVADFTSISGHEIGVRLRTLDDGRGELDLFGDTTALAASGRQLLTRFVHEHLAATAKDVERFRIYVCPHCTRPALDLRAVADRVRERKPYVVCQGCEGHIPLWDEIEEEFASADLRAAVQDAQRQSAALIERESRLRAMIGDVIATAGRANNPRTSWIRAVSPSRLSSPPTPVKRPTTSCSCTSLTACPKMA